MKTRLPEYLIYKSDNGEVAKIYNDGYVNFGDYDMHYGNEDDAIRQVKQDGFYFEGVDRD